MLISGETGTGKELVAKAVHQGSLRAANPLVYLNCAALPESVAESELFGHVKGAFTGAISNRSGKFEMADNGTLFLDEIGELSLALQAKLLRVLQYGDIQRVGDDRSLRVDVRVLAATNRDLRQEVVEGRFRANLYHRLSVFRCRFRRYASGKVTWCCWRAISASSAACGWGWRGSFWLRRRETGCSSGPGRATCANWSMLSIGRWCWRGPPRPVMKWSWSRSISSLRWRRRCCRLRRRQRRPRRETSICARRPTLSARSH